MTPPRKVLVLGSAGFAGCAIVSALVDKGIPTIALGRSEATLEEPGLQRVRGSLEDKGLVQELLGDVDAIVHAASLTTPGASANDPALEVLGNLLPLARLLECAPLHARRRVVYLSSGGAIYGDLARGADEQTARQPRSYYGAGKVAAEAMLHACVATSDWTAISLRPSNLYGPRQRVTKGFAIIPTLFDRATDGKPFEIWGDGAIVRDYCYIDDLADAVVAALVSPAPHRFRAYNVASGETASVVDLVRACEQASGRPIDVAFRPARSVDVPHVSPDPRAIQNELGWSARIGLAEGLARTWQWRGQAEAAPSV